MPYICCICSLYHRNFYPVTSAGDFSKTILIGYGPRCPAFKGCFISFLYISIGWSMVDWFSWRVEKIEL